MTRALLTLSALRKSAIVLVMVAVVLRLLVPTTLSNVVYAVAFLFLLNGAATNLRVSLVRRIWPLLLMAGAVGLSLIFVDTATPFFSAYALRFFYSIFMMLLIPFVIKDEGEYAFALSLVQYAGWIIAAFALQRLRSHYLEFLASRDDAFFDPNFLSLWIGASAVLTLDALTRARAWLALIVQGLGFCLMLLVIILLASRGTLITLGIAGVYILVVNYRRASRLIQVALPVLLLLVGGVVVRYALSISTLSQRIQDTTAASGGGRLGIWSIGLNEFLKESLPKIVCGLGLGGGSEIIGHAPSTLGYAAFDMHNAYLTVLTDFGVCGFIALLCIIAGAARLIGGGLPVFVVRMRGLFVYLLIGSATLTTVFHPYFWLFIGLFFAMPQRRDPVNQPLPDPAATGVPA